MVEEAEQPLSEYYRHISKGAWPFSTRDHGWPISDCSSEGLKAALCLARLPASKVCRRPLTPWGRTDHQCRLSTAARRGRCAVPLLATLPVASLPVVLLLLLSHTAMQVGPPIPAQRLYDCVTVILSYQVRGPQRASLAIFPLPAALFPSTLAKQRQRQRQIFIWKAGGLGWERVTHLACAWLPSYAGKTFQPRRPHCEVSSGWTHPPAKPFPSLSIPHLPATYSNQQQQQTSNLSIPHLLPPTSLLLQNFDGGMATYENTRSFHALEVSWLPTRGRPPSAAPPLPSAPCLRALSLQLPIQSCVVHFVRVGGAVRSASLQL